MTHCFLVRHAQTEWNEANRLQGHSDLPLSPLGHEQARRLAACFMHRRLKAIVTSGLIRSRQTAQAILEGNGHAGPAVIEPDLNEMHLGAWEGLTPEDIDARFEGAFRRWQVRPSSVIIPSAEPLETFRQRTRRALRQVLSPIGAGACVVVTHGGVIASILADVLGADFDLVLRRLRLDNGGISVVEFRTGSAEVLRINETSHLAPGRAGPRPDDGGPRSNEVERGGEERSA